MNSLSWNEQSKFKVEQSKLNVELVFKLKVEQSKLNIELSKLKVDQSKLNVQQSKLNVEQSNISRISIVYISKIELK